MATISSAPKMASARRGSWVEDFAPPRLRDGLRQCGIIDVIHGISVQDDSGVEKAAVSGGLLAKGPIPHVQARMGHPATDIELEDVSPCP